SCQVDLGNFFDFLSSNGNWGFMYDMLVIGMQGVHNILLQFPLLKQLPVA
ncbi:hypothetical protein KKC1_31040, partial [Calderihabitans maritimus]